MPIDRRAGYAGLMAFPLRSRWAILVPVSAMMALPPSDLLAASINAASCSRTDVANAVAAAADGDTINVPPGSCQWNPTLIVNKSISLIGAGIGQTVINGTDSSTFGRGSALDWHTKNTGNNPAGLSRLSGFTWRATAGAQGYAGGTILTFRGGSKNFRFDHNRIETTTTGGIQTWDRVTGVMDHNEFINVSAGLAHMIQATHSNWSATESSDCGPYTCGDSSWAADHTIGTQDNWYIEDNLIQNLETNTGWYCTDDQIGSRTIYRFNKLVNCTLQIHGTETGGRQRGARYLVTYRNVFQWTLNNFFPGLIANRGGSGRHFDNVATGSLQRLANLSTLRSNDDYDVNGHRGSYPYGRCGRRSVLSMTRTGTTVTAAFPAGSAGHYSNEGSYQTFSGADQPEYNGTFLTRPVSDTAISFEISGTPATPATGSITMVSPFDGNTDSTGYPCLDQAGAGKSILYSGSGPNNPPTISPIAAGPVTMEPILAWGNTLNGAQSDLDSMGVPVVEHNRDLFNQNDSCAGSSCSAGIGRGTTLPTGCTPTATNSGPYFWDTDEGGWNAPGVNGSQDGSDADGVLYKCTAPDVWTAFYTPFTYPHPLAAGAPTALNIAPARPRNFR